MLAFFVMAHLPGGPERLRAYWRSDQPLTIPKFGGDTMNYDREQHPPADPDAPKRRDDPADEEEDIGHGG